MMNRVCLGAAVFLCLLSEVLAQEPPAPATQPACPVLAAVKGDRVRARSGAGDNYPEVLRLERGDVVRVHGLRDGWCEVEVPGGFPVWVSAGLGERAFVEEREPGVGTVVVTALQMRPTAGTEHPSMGRLDPGARLTILSREGTWVRVVAPEDLRLHMHGMYLDLRGSDAELASRFAAAATDRRKALVEASPVAGPLVPGAEARKTAAERLREADRVFDEENARGGARMDFARVRRAYEEALAGAPSDLPARDRAEARLAEIERLEAVTQDLQSAESRIAAMQTERRATDERYLEELRAIASRPRPDESRKESFYIADGWIRRHVIGVIGNEPAWALEKGGKILFFIESGRYSLGEYLNKYVGILKADGPEQRAGHAVRTLRVEKLEILRQPR